MFVTVIVCVHVMLDPASVHFSVALVVLRLVGSQATLTVPSGLRTASRAVLIDAVDVSSAAVMFCGAPIGAAIRDGVGHLT